MRIFFTQIYAFISVLNYFAGDVVHALYLLHVVKEKLAIVPLFDVVDYVEELGFLKEPVETIIETKTVTVRCYKCRRPII